MPVLFKFNIVINEQDLLWKIREMEAYLFHQRKDFIFNFEPYIQQV